MTDQTDDEREFLAITEKDIFEEARDRRMIAVDAESRDRTLAKDDALFREGDQWDHAPTTTASAETPELTINFTDTLATRVVNNIKEQRPRGKAHPVGDGATIEIAEVINGVGRHVEYRSEASVAYDNAADQAVTSGWGYFRILSEYVSPDSFDQDLRILPIFNTFSVYMDPGAMMPTGCDAEWCEVVSKMKRTEYKRRYPRMDNTSWSSAGSDDEWAGEWEEKEHILLAEYFRIRERSDKLYLVRNAQGQEFTRYKSLMPKDPALLTAAGLAIVDERDSNRRQVEWFRLNGTRVVERGILPGTWIPIIRVAGNQRVIDGQVFRRGMVRNMKDPARMVNYGEVAKIRRLGLTPQSPWVAAEGQLDGHPEWDSSNREPVTVLTYKIVTIDNGQGGQIPLPPPVRQPPAQLEAGFAEFTQGMRSNLLAIAGMPNEPGQDTQGQVVSGVAQKRRQGLSDQSHLQYYDNLTLSIAHCWRIMLEYIPHYISTERMQRIIGEDSVPSMIKVNQMVTENGVTTVKNDLSVGRYDVVMDTGPGYQTKREEGAENLISLMSIPELAEMVVKVGADLIVRAIDAPYMQELADRISAMTPEGMEKIMEELPARAKAIVQSLSAQLKATQQQLQQVQADLKYGITKSHLDNTTKAHDIEESNKTKRADTQTRADVERFKALLSSHTKLSEAEINGMVQLLNTHAEAAHEATAAHKLIKAGERAEQGA